MTEERRQGQRRHDHAFAALSEYMSRAQPDRRQNAAGQVMKPTEPQGLADKDQMTPVPDAPSSTLPLSALEIDRVAKHGVLYIAGTSEQLAVHPFCDQALRAIELEAELAHCRTERDHWFKECEMAQAYATKCQAELKVGYRS